MPANELHVDENLLSIYPPGINFWNWYTVAKYSPDHPKALGFANGDMRTKFDQKIKLFEPNRRWLSSVTAGF
jgi:hypothetical protein